MQTNAIKLLEELVNEKTEAIAKVKGRLASEEDTMLQGMFNKQVEELTKELEAAEVNLKQAIAEDELTNKDWSKYFGEYPELKKILEDTQHIGGSVSYNNKKLALAEQRIKGGAKSILLEGPTGTGKTTWMRHVGAMLNRPVISINASTGMDEDDLIGKYAIGKEGKPTFVDGPLIVAMRTGSILVIEEINGSKPSVMLKLNSLLDDLNQIDHPVTREVIKAEKGFVFGGTLNLGYAGTRKMNKAFINRFEIAIKFEQITESQFNSIMKSKIVDITQDELNIAWYIFKSIDNIITREEYNAAISIRQMVSLIKTKRLDSHTQGGAVKSSWRAAIEVALKSQVSGFDEDMDKEVEKVIQSLANNVDKKTGKLPNGTQPMMATASGLKLKTKDDEEEEEA